MRPSLQPRPQPSPCRFTALCASASATTVRLSAFGLKTKLGGTLLVDQDEHQLGLSGQLKLAAGSFRAYGQNLLIEKGEVTFSGPVDDPLVNIEAIRNPDSIADDVTRGRACHRTGLGS